MTDNLNNCYDSIDNEEKEVLVNDIKKLVSELLMRHASEDDDEKQWMLHNCNNPILLKQLGDINSIGLHILDAIGRLEPVNSITISKDTNIPKGTVSKIIPKLIAKEFIIKVPLPGNKKEYLFHITPFGKELFELHQELHKQTELGINRFLKKYDTKELQFVIRMLSDFADISWLNKESI